MLKDTWAESLRDGGFLLIDQEECDGGRAITGKSICKGRT